MKLRITHYISTLCVIVSFLISSQHTILAFDTSVYSESSVLSSGRWVRVQVTENGMHRITPSDLRSWGFSNMDNIRVFGYGGAPISDVLSIGNYIDGFNPFGISFDAFF